MNSKKTLVALASIAFALVVAGPAAAACSVSTLSECDNDGLVALIAQLLAGQTTTQTTGTTGTTATGNVPAACAGITFDRNLSQGSTGADVKCLQAFLNQSADTQVAATGVGSAGNETTYFGALTTAAVKSFQTKYGITPVYGYVGPITRAKLNELLASGTSTGTGTTLPAGCTTATGYSPTTGEPCTPVSVTTLPEGCTTATGYSPTTGLPCSGTGTATVTGTPLTVALASDTPAGGNILKGEANKTVAKVVLTAGTDADATINTLKVKSFGTADLTNVDISAVKVFENGKQIGTTQYMVSGVATFTFAPALTIIKGTSKTLDIVVSVSSNATGVSATVKMGIEAAASIGGNSTFTGTFPVVGNAYTIVAGGALGSVSVTNGVVVPVTSVGSGTKDVELGNFVVSAGTNEDVNINQFVVTYLGTPRDGTGSAILDTDINNIRVVVDGTVVGTASAFSSRKATVNFTSPLAISRGSAKTLKVLGDVVSGSGRVVELQADIDSVSGVGATSGVGVAGPSSALAAGATNEIAITAGTLSVSVSASTPQGTAAQFVKSTSAQTLGVFDIRAVGEDVLVSSLGFKITGPSGANGSITSVGLYNEGGALISSNLATFAAADWDDSPATTNYFNLSATIPANTTMPFYVKGITNGINSPDPASIVVSLEKNLTGNKSIIGTGMNSSAQAGSYNVTSASTLTLPAVSINQGPTATYAGDALETPLDQSIMSPASQVTVGTLKVTAQREDQSLRSLVLTGVPSTGTMDTLLNGVALYDGTTQVTNFVAPATGADTVTFSGTDILSPAVTFVKGTAKTLRIVANTASSITGTNFYWTIAATSGQFTTIGKTSGQLFQSSTAGDLRVSSGNTAAGTYTLNPIVVEILKDAASPSGTVGRGTYKTYATWGMNSYGTTSDVNLTSVTFYSKVGLPTGATSSMFRLVDTDTDTAITVGTTTVDAASGTVTFDIASSNLVITNGVTKRVSLQITTTDTSAWAQNTSMHWTIIPSTSVTFAETGAAVGSSSGVNYTIPADTNLVSIGT
ncbi:MAG: peptidoglycan-binding domain-containing protein [Candidatus Paceibacterota bacterium]